MITQLFGNIRQGRLSPFQFVMGLCVLCVLALASLFCNQYLIQNGYASPLYLQLRWLWLILLLLPLLNITAKRIRDIGLPGWWGLLLVCILTSVLIAFTPATLSGGIATLEFFCLLVCQPDTLVRVKTKNHPEQR